MTQKQKAVAVAKDVLKHLASYKVLSGNGYIASQGEFDPGDYFGLCKVELAQKIKQKCNVCALGASLISAFNLGFANKTEYLYAFLAGEDSGGDKEFAQVKAIFGPKFRKIEDAFEATDREDYFYWDPDKEFSDEKEFGFQFKDDKERLRAIMQNIVDNNGNFVPGPKGVNAEKYLKKAARKKK